MLRSARQQRDRLGASIIFLEQHERRVLNTAQVRNRFLLRCCPNCWPIDATFCGFIRELSSVGRTAAPRRECPWQGQHCGFQAFKCAKPILKAMVIACLEMLGGSMVLSGALASR